MVFTTTTEYTGKGGAVGHKFKRTLGNFLACAWKASTVSFIVSIWATTSIQKRSPKPWMVVITVTYNLRRRKLASLMHALLNCERLEAGPSSSSNNNKHPH